MTPISLLIFERFEKEKAQKEIYCKKTDLNNLFFYKNLQEGIFFIRGSFFTWNLRDFSLVTYGIFHLQLTGFFTCKLPDFSLVTYGIFYLQVTGFFTCNLHEDDDDDIVRNNRNFNEDDASMKPTWPTLGVVPTDTTRFLFVILLLIFSG